GVEHAGGDQVAGAPAEVDPGLPAAHQLAAPFVVDGGAQPVAGGGGQAAQRVAVEVDQLRVTEVPEDESVAEGGERVGRVEVRGAPPGVEHRRTVPPGDSGATDRYRECGLVTFDARACGPCRSGRRHSSTP